MYSVKESGSVAKSGLTESRSKNYTEKGFVLEKSNMGNCCKGDDK